MTLSASAAKQRRVDSIPPQEITSDSPCVGHCTTVLGDDVCRSCLRTFDELNRWLEMNEEERRAVNQRIVLLAGKAKI